MSSTTGEPLRIGYLFDGHLRPSEGVPAYVADVGGYMVQQDHEVHYVAGGSDGELQPFTALGRTARFGVNGNQVDLALPVSARRAEELVDSVDPDIFHLQMPHNPLGTGRVLHRAGLDVPAIATFHVLPNSRPVEFAMAAMAKVTARTNRRINCMISNSSATQGFLHRVYGLDSVLIPNPVDLDKFQTGQKLPEYDDGRTNIVFLGRLVERKGAQYLLDAVASLDSKTKSQVRLLIAGKGELEPQIKAQIAALGLTDNTVLLGYVKDEDKPDLLATADLAVFPATGGESFGIVLAEAMAARAGVVIGGNNPGYKSVLRDTPEAIVDPKNIAKFGAALTWFIKTPEERDRLHALQQKVVREFDIKVVGRAIESLYHEALAR